jgi:hypothetical protein
MFRLILNLATLLLALNGTAALVGPAAVTDVANLYKRNSASGQAYLSGDELTGLAAYFHMDEASGAAVDVIGAQNLSDINSVGTAAGIITNSRATTVAGINYLSSSSGTYNRAGSDWTITMWFRLTSKVSSPVIASKYNGNNADSQFLFYYNGSTLVFLTIGEHDECGTVYTETPITGSDPSLNTWYFVVFGVSGGDMFYSENGAAATVAAMTDPMHAGSNPALQIGSFEGNLGVQNIPGSVDEVGYYTVAVADAQIASIYNSGAGKTRAP